MTDDQPNRVLAAAVAFHRVPLLAVAAALAVGVFALSGNAVPFPASSFSALYLFPVNLASLLLVRWLVHREGGRVRDLIGFSRKRLDRDILWGILWLFVLFLPFVLAIMGTMFALYGADALTQFEAVFAPPADTIPILPFAVSLTLAILVVVTFVPLNAPVEELVYRGYAQRRFGSPTWVAILVPAIAFGVQHTFFSPTVPGMLVYAVAFFAWAVVGGIIYAKQRRLMPLIVAHLLVNLFTSAPALLIPFLLSS